jgi:HSP20 family protein
MDERPAALERAGGFPSVLTLHREMNRLFDNVFRGVGPLGSPLTEGQFGWPRLELSETDRG